MKIKVCGLRRRADCELAHELGAAHLGFVLAPDSPRCIGVDELALLLPDLPAAIAPVLVFRAAPALVVRRAAERLGVERVQLHRCADEANAELEAAGLRVHRVREADRFDGELCAFEPAPSAERPWLIDVGGGGSGRRFDWNRLPAEPPAHVWVAGGIGPEHVAELAARAVYGADLSSALERAPGIKDPDRMRALFGALETTPR